MSDREQYVCFECVRDPCLAAEIRSNGKSRECSCCGAAASATWGLDDLADRVKEVFDAHYTLTPSGPDMWQEMLLRDKESDYVWTREGDPPGSIVEELTGLPESVCDDLIELWGRGSYWDYKDPDYEDPYGGDALYVEKRSSHLEIEQRWKELQDELLHRSRFFSRKTHDFLTDLFGDVQHLETYEGPVVERHTPEDFDGIYRARTAFDEGDVRKILEGLPQQLGALRGRGVSAGRMNADAIRGDNLSQLYPRRAVRKAKSPATC